MSDELQDLIAAHIQESWPEWTCITTPWNDPGGADPDEYHVECFRDHQTFDGTRAECVAWAQGHDADPEPEV